jgi:hypothetical protein
VIFIISTGRTCMSEPSKDLVLETGCPELTMYFFTGPWNDHSASDILWPNILSTLSSVSSLKKKNLCHNMAPPRFDACPLVSNFAANLWRNDVDHHLL